MVSARRLSSMLAGKSRRNPRNIMSGLKIYGIARTRAFRALWMAKELGLDYEHDPVEIAIDLPSASFIALTGESAVT